MIKLILVRIANQTANFLPWAIVVPVPWKNPYERVKIESAYPRIIPWAASGGNVHSDWYKNNINSQYIFNKD
ncbi:MAG: LruC domain-containing protein [bacterium]|jgi:LruC domain-containing protein